jgi:hypothetical protein
VSVAVAPRRARAAASAAGGVADEGGSGDSDAGDGDAYEEAAAAAAAELAAFPLFGGHGNNAAHRDWGSRNSPLVRIAAPHALYVSDAAAEFPLGARADAGADTSANASLIRMLPSPRLVSNLLFARAEGLRDESGIAGSGPGAGVERAASQLLPYFAAFVFADIAASGPRLRDARVFSGLFDAHDDNVAVPRGDAIFDPEGTGNASLPFVRAPYVMAPLRLIRTGAGAGAGSSASGATCRHPLNLEPSFLHLDPLYGASTGAAGLLLVREGGGRLRMRLGNASALAAASPANAAAAVAADASHAAAEAFARLAPGVVQRAALAQSWLAPPGAGALAVLESMGALANPYGLPAESLVLAGSERANLDLGSVLFTTAFAREHNRLWALLRQGLEAAAAPAPAAPGGPGGFGAARVSAALACAVEATGVGGLDGVLQLTLAASRAQYQAIAFYELLPALVGAARFARLPRYSGYDARADPAASAEFAAGAALAWHALVAGRAPRLGAGFRAWPRGPVALRDSYFAAGRLLREGGLDPLVRGLWSQPADARGHAHGGAGTVADGARNAFLGRGGRGSDLAALDLQRGRDHGLPGYNAVRTALGLPRVASFAEIAAGGAGQEDGTAGAVNAAAAERAAARARARAAALAELYAGRVDDVELLAGALLERPVAGGVLGETFAAVVEEQFLRARAGDRFWFESEEAPLALSLDALYGGGAGGAECAGGRAGGAAALRREASLGALLGRVTGVDMPAARGEALRVRRAPARKIE